MPTGGPWDTVGYPWDAHEQSVGNQWAVRRLSMGYTLAVLVDQPMGMPWASHGQPELGMA